MLARRQSATAICCPDREAGCTDAEVCAITGQPHEMVEHYAPQVNQRKLATAAILKPETAMQARTENERDDTL
jgi:hypothetical protein